MYDSQSLTYFLHKKNEGLIIGFGMLKVVLSLGKSMFLTAENSDNVFGAVLSIS